MGIDFLEIVLAVEERFGITIHDDEAEKICTVGDLVSFIHSRITLAQSVPCPTLPAFLTLRKLVRSVCGDEGRRIRPRESVMDAMPSRERRELWRRMRAEFGTWPRSLRRPRLLRQTLLGISLVVLFVSLLPAIAIALEILPLSIVVAACVIGCLHFATVPFRSVAPEGWLTFGEIATKIVGATAATKMTHLRTDDEVFIEVRSLLVEALAVDAAEVVPSARIVEDICVG